MMNQYKVFQQINPERLIIHLHFYIKRKWMLSTRSLKVSGSVNYTCIYYSLQIQSISLKPVSFFQRLTGLHQTVQRGLLLFLIFFQYRKRTARYFRHFGERIIKSIQKPVKAVFPCRGFPHFDITVQLFVRHILIGKK